MADYITLIQAQTYGGFDDTGEVDLNLIIPAACLTIDNYCGRTFQSTAVSTHTFTRLNLGQDAFRGRILFLDEDLAAASSSITGSPTVSYLPENKPPYYAIVLTEGGWAYPTVSVVGHWAYSELPPADIILATLQLTKWMYDSQENNQGTNVMITPEGQVLLPSGLPDFIKTLLAPYRKVTVT